ncbi:NAD dependent epimerase/dehydratase family protein [Dictyocaulus viviparus]|uniref:NAD dependent epimerase/dehydratase family protein n=1 Tax=Dictyocaulus viviparus TaxID=29172 RepID=A0A0D8YEP3_DICVI|nr:NAD dependent epimerase/dehydratase family protein [Dictyocaulus viviparus]
MNYSAIYVVLVTGASGYIASHCVKLLLDDGYRVRGTVRSLKNEKKVAPIRKLQQDERLELVEADLLNEDSWKSAVSGCQYILHIASPFMIVPNASCVDIAVNGTLNVLRAASKEYSVRKVVLTSSCVAVNEGHPQNKVFDETSWTDVSHPNVDHYVKSKTLAEKAAWNFVDNIKDGNKFALTALNPTFVLGPLMIDEEGASVSLMRRFLNKEMPGVPDLNLPCVDVRDVAKAHVEAMRRSQSDGERILITYQPSFWFRDISRILGKEFRSQGFWIPYYRVPYWLLWLYSFIDREAAACLHRIGFWIPYYRVPYWLLWLYSFIDREAAACLHRIGNTVRFDNSKAKRLLGIEFNDPTKAMIEMCYSLIERGIVKKRPGYKGVPEQYRQ